MRRTKESDGNILIADGKRQEKGVTGRRALSPCQHLFTFKAWHVWRRITENECEAMTHITGQGGNDRVRGVGG